MIRDEFKQKQKQDFSSREIKKIRKLGERAFYVSSINKIKQSIKIVNFSTVLIAISCILPFVLLLDAILFSVQEIGVYVTFFIICLVYILSILWFIVTLPSLKKKANKYQEKLKKLSFKEVNKYKSINI